MAVICARCGRQFDVTLFQFGNRVRCPCGRILAGSYHTLELRNPPEDPRRAGREGMETLRREADAIARMILDPAYAAVDIAIARAGLRETCERLFPDRMELFDWIYEARFDRLWEQFRAPLEGEGPE
ncbi:MAG: hypothetical protein JXP34_06040 [Planctomycetes bacterium]|nr:hypothetical protein [Planctomycetota bacterium]